MTRLAVVIPVWDAYVRWLPEAVTSVRQQNHDVDLVVVDNASTVPVPQLDGTRIVRADRRLTTGAARNLGLAAIDAPLVVFLDADDLMLPGSLAALETGMAAHPGAAAFVLGIIDGDTGERHRSPRPLARRLARVPTLLAAANTVWSLVPTQGATVMRTAQVREAGGYADRSHGEDWALSACLGWRGHICFGKGAGLVYRWRGDSPGREDAPITLRDDARCVRERVARDAKVPCTVRLLVPAIHAGHVCLIGFMRPLVRASRSVTMGAGDRRP